MLRIGLVTAFVGALVLGPSTSFAVDDSAALQGITEGKIAFDISDGGGKLLLKRLDIIDETRRSLQRPKPDRTRSDTRSDHPYESRASSSQQVSGPRT